MLLAYQDCLYTKEYAGDGNQETRADLSLLATSRKVYFILWVWGKLAVSNVCVNSHLKRQRTHVSPCYYISCQVPRKKISSTEEKK
jgi:hypothetical protein